MSDNKDNNSEIFALLYDIQDKTHLSFLFKIFISFLIILTFGHSCNMEERIIRKIENCRCNISDMENSKQ